jgi:hypothetical protein
MPAFNTPLPFQEISKPFNLMPDLQKNRSMRLLTLLCVSRVSTWLHVQQKGCRGVAAVAQKKKFNSGKPNTKKYNIRFKK